MNGLSGQTQRAKESKRLIEIAYRETYLLKLFFKRNILATGNVWLGKKDTIDLVAEKPLTTLISRPMLRKVKINMQWNDPIKAPIKKKQVVGKIFVEIPNSEKIEINLAASNSVEQLGPFSKIKSAINYLLFGSNALTNYE